MADAGLELKRLNDEIEELEAQFRRLTDDDRDEKEETGQNIIEKQGQFRKLALTHAENNQNKEQKKDPFCDELFDDKPQLTNVSPLYSTQKDAPKKSLSLVKIAKPQSCTTGDDIDIFMEQFEKFIILGGFTESNLDFYLLSLLKDKKMYNKLKSVKLTAEEKGAVTLLIKAYKKHLYPESEILTMRNELVLTKLSRSETVEDFALKIGNMIDKVYAGKDYGDQAALSAFLNGIRDQEIKKDLLKETVKTFDQAVSSAVKFEKIKKSLADESAASGDLGDIIQVMGTFNNGSSNNNQYHNRLNDQSQGRNNQSSYYHYSSYNNTRPWDSNNSRGNQQNYYNAANNSRYQQRPSQPNRAGYNPRARYNRYNNSGNWYSYNRNYSGERGSNRGWPRNQYSDNFQNRGGRVGHVTSYIAVA